MNDFNIWALLLCGVLPLLIMWRSPILGFLYVGLLLWAGGDKAIGNLLAYMAETIVIGVAVTIVTLPIRMMK